MCVPIDLPTGGLIRQTSPVVDYQVAVQIGSDLNSNLPAFADGDVDSFLDLFGLAAITTPRYL